MKQLSFSSALRGITGLLLAFSTLPAMAQTRGSDAAPGFAEIVDVRVINLEVVVTKRGERVEGLKSEDFRLLVDGQEVPVEYFTEVHLGRAVDGGRGGGTTVPALEPGEAVGTRMLVFIDDSFAVTPYRNRVLKRLSDQLTLLGPQDRMAVVAFDGRKVDLLTSWTRSLPELERAYEAARQRKAYGLFNYSRRLDRLDFDYRLGFASGFDRTFGLYSRPGYRFGAVRGGRVAYQLERVVDAATSTLRGFAKPPGRKVMLLVSGGWPSTPWDEFSSTVGYAAARPDRSMWSSLIDTANRLGYTLYPIDAQGVTSQTGGAQYATAAESDFAAALSRDQEWVEEGTLHHLARQTGGRALIDGASVNALERTIDDTRSYYWLGFTPSWQENDERHRVKVEVRGKGFKVRSRKSFSDLSRQTEVTMLVESSRLFDLPIPGESSDLVVSFGEPEKAGLRKVLVPLRLDIPLDQVTLLPHQKGYATQLELRVAVTDDRGETADIPVVPIRFEGEVTPGEGEMATFELGLKMRRRPHKLLISLHDTASGTILSKRAELTL